MKKAHASPEADAPPLRPDALSLAHMAASLMAIALQRGPDAVYRSPPPSERTPRTRPISPVEVARQHAVREARILFDECAVAIGARDNPGNIVTRADLYHEALLSGETSPDPGPLAMSLALASLAIQMLSAGTPRAAIVSEALSLLSESYSEPCSFQDADTDTAPIPAPPQWPATLGNFYSLIMKVRDKADGQPRFRSYLRSIHSDWLACLSPEWSADGADKRGDADFLDLQSKGFDKAAWVSHTKGYRRWWLPQLHLIKQAAGRKGYAAKAEQNDAATKPIRRAPPPRVTGNPAIDRLIADMQPPKRRRPKK
jgi:hypothetical protein